jgi:hypothetical protein
VAVHISVFGNSLMEKINVRIKYNAYFLYSSKLYVAAMYYSLLNDNLLK